MSRCFPYPPPGYTLSRANKEALIESIELQKEREKSILELKQKSEKEHKRKKEKSKKEHKEKKEKSKDEHKGKDKEQRKKDKEQRKKEKREKKDKNKEKDQSHQNIHKSDGALSNSGEKLRSYTKIELLQKGCEAEPMQLERSSLTEEHGQAVCPNAPSCSLDSTENSNKRKRQSSPEDVSRAHGKVIRIKLSKKPDDSGPSTSGRVQLPTQPTNDTGLGHTRNGVASTLDSHGKFSRGIPGRTIGEQICTTSQQVHTVASVRKPTKIPVMTPMQKMELEYNTLLENLVQPQLLDAFLPDDDLDWLKPAKNLDRRSETKLTSGNTSTTCSGCQPFWPCSQYLQEADVYALPYTIPF